MSLFKRGNVWWCYLHQDGIRHQYSTGTTNRKQAKTIEAKLREDLNSRRFDIVQTDPQFPFDDLAARFVASGSVRPHHLYHLKFLLPFFSGTALPRITKSLAEEFRRERHRRNPSIKEATVNRDLSVLRHILYWAVDEQLVVANPLARLKMARERRTRRQILSVAEEQSLLGAATGHLQTMIVCALDTGMRRGEITSQRWEDIDFPRKLLVVTRSKTPEGESREIPLNRRLYDLLVQFREPEGLIIGFRGKPVTIVKRSWATALKNSRICHVRFHDLRHTFNTRLMEAGVLQEVRMALMGHSSGRGVHAMYTHIELPIKREAIRKLEAWKVNQEEHLKHQVEKEGEEHASTEVHPEASRDEFRQIGSQTVEEEDANRDRSRTGRKAQD